MVGTFEPGPGATEGNDTFIGTNASENVAGLGGDDVLRGFSGDDTLDGGDGNDTLGGGKGDDSLIGGDGNDVLYTGPGLNVALGGEGNDTIVGSGLLDGGAGNDSLYGGSRDDTLIGGSGNDKLFGNQGDDVIYTGPGDNTVYGADGNDTVVFEGAHADYTFSYFGTETLAVGVDGTVNHLVDVETFQFTDTTIPNPNPNVNPCFVGGTRIATRRGEVAVEELRVGDEVRVLSGRQGDFAPVVWMGWRHVDLLGHRQPEKVQPVRVRAGALGPHSPARDLLVSPDHCLWIDGLLIQARLLVDGQAILRESGRAAVTYWHVELPRHDALLAEGCPAESYLDTGNRSAFVNGVVTALHPDFGSDDGRGGDRLAPRFQADDPRLAGIRARIAARWQDMATPRAA